jgi:hypothetical protein
MDGQRRSARFSLARTDPGSGRRPGHADRAVLCHEQVQPSALSGYMLRRLLSAYRSNQGGDPSKDRFIGDMER